MLARPFIRMDAKPEGNPMIDKSRLKRSKAIQRRTGRTFHFATRLLPGRIRRATYVLYAFFRIADDVVDDPDPPPETERRAELDRIRAAALGERDAEEPVLEAFREIRERYGIPACEVREFVAAMEADVSTARYETFEELEEYLRGSSVAVAYMMLSVMEPEHPERARTHARALGEAFQLTNFLRDVREDVREYGRIYLPRATLDRHGVTEERIERLEFTEGFGAAMRAELARTERRYRAGVDGIALLPEGCQFAVLLAAVLYAEHHRLIRAQGYDVLSSRPQLTARRRVGLFVRTWWHWRLTGDPCTTFDAVSAVPPADDCGDEGETGLEAEVPVGGDRPAEPTRGVVGGLRSLLPLVGSK